MKPIIRDKSVLTGKQNLEKLYTYENFPVFIGATNEPLEKDLYVDLSLGLCPETGVIQLTQLIPPEIIYSGYHSEALGAVWEEHHQEFATFISSYYPNSILEIGGSDGRLALKYIGKKKNIKWTIVEPNPTPFPHPSIEFISNCFDSKFETDIQFDTIIHSHTFEHMYFPREFLEKIASLLVQGQYHIFSVPNLFNYLEKKYTNVLNFEHTIFLTEYFIDYLLSEYNFEIVEKKYYQDHSIFYATKKVSKKPQFQFTSKYQEYKKMYAEYLLSNKKIIEDLNIKIKKAKGDVYLFGAHVFSQFLLNQGLDKSKIHGILDNSKIKQGKRLYGTTLQILPPDVLKDQQDVYVILKAGAYQDEIKKQLLSINSGITIWE